MLLSVCLGSLGGKVRALVKVVFGVFRSVCQGTQRDMTHHGTWDTELHREVGSI